MRTVVEVKRDGVAYAATIRKPSVKHDEATLTVSVLAEARTIDAG